MFPKQKCWACQNRAWEGTTSGKAILENKTLREEVTKLQDKITELEKRLDNSEDKTQKTYMVPCKFCGMHFGHMISCRLS